MKVQHDHKVNIFYCVKGSMKYRPKTKSSWICLRLSKLFDIKLIMSVTLIVTILLAVSRRLKTFVVAGPSMLPTLTEGDRLLGLVPIHLKVGDIVVFNHEISSLKLIKRISFVDGERIEVIGDNDILSIDSKQFGYIDKSQIYCKIIFRYFPSNRAGIISSRKS